MTQRLTDIRASIPSTDEAVLRQSLAFVHQRLKEEQDRGKAAETRASAIVAILGIFLGLFIPFILTIKPAIKDEYEFVYLFLGTAILFLLRGIYYALRILGVSKQYRLTVNYVNEIANGTIQDALKADIAAVIWLYQESIQPNTRKLFWLNRAQRNGVLAISLFVLYQVFLFLFQLFSVPVPPYTTFVLAAVLLLVLLLADVLAERLGIWRGT